MNGMLYKNDESMMNDEMMNFMIFFYFFYESHKS